MGGLNVRGVCAIMETVTNCVRSLVGWYLDNWKTRHDAMARMVEFIKDSNKKGGWNW